MPENPDPCAEVQELRNALRDLAMGGSVSQVRYGEDMVSYTKADTATLRELLREAEKKCAASQGKRSRYARRVRVRPY